MKSLQRRLPRIMFILLALSLALLATRGPGDTTRLLIIGSLAMFACCWSSAIHLPGARAALHLVLIAGATGWASEVLGSRYGWFFGQAVHRWGLPPKAPKWMNALEQRLRSAASAPARPAMREQRKAA